MGGDNQQNTTAPSRRKRRLSGRKESSSVPVLARWPWARADTGRSLWQLASGGSVPPCSVLSLPCAAFEPLFLAVRAAYRFRWSQCVQSTHNLKAQPSFEDCCAKNKSGYLRIRATAVKERIEAVTNGQGRQGREDLQDQARPRRRNRLPSARAVRGVPRSDRETSTRADGVATTRA